jgi:hypothetical protein
MQHPSILKRNSSWPGLGRRESPRAKLDRRFCGDPTISAISATFRRFGLLRHRTFGGRQPRQRLPAIGPLNQEAISYVRHHDEPQFT